MVSIRRQFGVVIRRLKDRSSSYCQTTSLHGFRYITSKNSSKFQSLFWTIICVISTYLCIVLILDQLERYRTNRITTQIETTTFPIWQIPFPAVTICNFNAVYKENLGELQQLLVGDFSTTEIDNFFTNLSNLISVSSNYDDTYFKLYKFYDITKKLESYGYNTEELMAKLAQPCDRLLLACYWETHSVDCNRIFHRSKSTSGYCCSFNYYGVNDKNREKYEPIYAAGIGSAFSLEIHLNPEFDQYISAIKQTKGLDVVLHESHAFPDTSLYSTMIYPGSEMMLLIRPEIIESEEGIKNIDISYRKCVFDNEIKTAWAPLYSYPTCLNQCKAQTIIDYCRCIPYYYPAKANLRYCTLIDVPCLKKNTYRFRQTFNTDDLAQNDSQLYKKHSRMDCKCLPQCNEINYYYQVDQQPLKPDNELTNFSILSISFGRITCTKFTRNIYLTWELVLASIGGLIGLCLGGSILSIIELIYYIFDTLFSRYKRKYQPKLYLRDFQNVQNFIRNQNVYKRKQCF